MSEYILLVPTHPLSTLLYFALGPKVLRGLFSLWLPVGFGKWEVPAGP